MSADSAGKTVLITGASSGIGEACALRFAASGARLILAARREDRLVALGEQLESSSGIEPLLIQLDVRDVGVVTRVLEELPAGWRDVDVLVNNAGLARGFASLAEGDTRDWDEMIDTNVKGLLYVTRALLPGMIRRNSGHIINIGSIAGSEPYPNGAAYCGSKAAVDAISAALRMDLLGSAVRVTDIQPGMVETEFSLVRFHGDAERAGNVYQGVVPLTADDVADTVVYAASRPPHVNIDSIKLKPVAQAWATQLARSSLPPRP
ncbi:MAG: SDR family oxidoreductase [Gemmatimonadota bacterium]|jgi:NADP-dependent 3-hydroxy acid dehydrogenase YdfG|nr:SDR family oxidoreductase [Gemmatimonadota bacterium]